jgi:gamma-glutamylcyclotransferase (GGCT)/AIG2-like uncharacterized protein YtfP
MHLFTYGTLMFPEVWKTVVGKEFPTVPAALPGYQIFRVAGAVFPGIVAIASSPVSPFPPPPSPPVPGLVYLDLDAATIARLDRFEDDFYVRQTVTVTCEDGCELAADAYLVPENRRDVLTSEIWTAEEFAARGHLAEFVTRYRGFNRLE